MSIRKMITLGALAAGVAYLVKKNRRTAAVSPQPAMPAVEDELFDAVEPEVEAPPPVAAEVAAEVTERKPRAKARKTGGRRRRSKRAAA